MKSMPEKPLVDQRIEQLIDANLDRGKEGLRVIEEWCRYGLKNKELIIKIKLIMYVDNAQTLVKFVLVKL